MKPGKPMIITVIMFSAALVCAEEQKIWGGSGEIGFLMTAGNSDTRSVNARAALKHDRDRLLGELKMAALYSSEETKIEDEKKDRTSAEKYNAAAKIGYKFTPADYFFVNADYEDDRFSGYDYRSNYTAGYGRKIVSTDMVKFDIEIGPGYRYDKIDHDGREEEAVLRGYAVFGYNFSEGTAFQQDVTVLAGSDNTGTKSVTAFKSKIAGALSMKASYAVSHNSHVPDDKDKTDTETALTLVYDF